MSRPGPPENGYFDWLNEGDDADNTALRMAADRERLAAAEQAKKEGDLKTAQELRREIGD